MNIDDLTDGQIDDAAWRAAFLAVFAPTPTAARRPPACPDCGGTGDCRDCDGTGVSEDNHDDDGGCSVCLGLGSCVACDDESIVVEGQAAS